MILSSARRNDIGMLALAIVVIVLDQLTKAWIVAYFGVPYTRPPIPIIGHFLEIFYIRNTGVAFSLLEGQGILFLFIAIAVVVIGALYWRLRESASLVMKLTFGLILGGAFGNLIDRFRQNYVVDFIHFQIPGKFDFPVFNVADSSISVGVLLLAFLLWRANPGTEPPAHKPAAAHKGDTSLPPSNKPLARSPAPSLTTPRVRNPNARGS